MAETTPRGIVRLRMILWGLVLIAAIAAAALYFFRPPVNAGLPQLGVTGKPFSLQSTKGGTFTEASLAGTPSLVFFGYTSCPDVCPTTMAEAVQWREDLKLKPEQLRTIFVTVDPARDTKELLTQYLGAFDPNVIGLVGDAAQTEAVKADFGVFSESQKPDASGNYLVNHTASVFLIGKDGEFEGTIAYQEDIATAEAKIKRLVGG